MFIPEFETDLIIWLQSNAPGLTPLTKFFSIVGYGTVYILIFAVLFWVGDRRLGLRLALILLLGSALNALVKIALHMPRPYWVDPRIRGFYLHSSFGMPSGHAQTAASALGLLGAALKRGWVWIVLGMSIFLIGFSRIHLGVHFPSQVLCGWAAGFLVLALFLKLEQPVLDFVRKKSPFGQVCLCLAVSLSLVAVGVVTAIVSRDFRLPDHWVATAGSSFPETARAHPLSLKTLVTAAAGFFGIAAGAIVTTARDEPAPSDSLRQKILRVLTGGAGMAMVLALFAVGPFEGRVSANAWRYLVGGLSGFWVTGGAPLAFRLLKI